MQNGVSVIIALGSNLAHQDLEPKAILDAAVIALCKRGIDQVNQSSWWRSKAWPDPLQPSFYNGVVMGQTLLEPVLLMQLLLEIEAQFGRTRSQVNAPRPLDLDLIAYGDRIEDGPDLILPHPRAAERRFVMGPIAEIAPDWVHPILGKTAQALFECTSIGLDAEPIALKA